jgi:hypothetical protein
MNNIVRDYPFDRYSEINRPEDFVDIEGAKEQIEKLKHKPHKKKEGNRAIPSSQKKEAGRLSYNEVLWIMQSYEA